MANRAGVVKHFAAVAAVVLFGALALTGMGPTGRAAAASGGSGDVLALLNAERSAAGLPALREAPDLTAAAQLRAESMARTGTLQHTRSLNRLVVPGDGLGENVGYAASAQDVNREFMESSSHRSAILSSSYDEVGVGVVPGDGVIWVSEIFRNAAAPAPLPSPARPAITKPTPGPPPPTLPAASAGEPKPLPVAATTTVPKAASPVPVPVTARVQALHVAPALPPPTVARTVAAPARTSVRSTASAVAPKAATDTVGLEGTQVIGTSAPDVRLRAAATAAGMVAALLALVPVRLVPRRRRHPAIGAAGG
ncbi:MAG: CAP domain-containing protein [Acidimicrobiales bacterium]